MTRRTAAGVTVLMGVALLVTVFGNRLFSRTEPFEEMTNDFRPLMQQEAIDQLQTDLNQLESIGVAFPQTVLPSLAQALGTTPEALAQQTQAQWPDVAAGLEAIPAIVPQQRALLNTFETELDRFNKADSIPTAGISTTPIPWAIAAAGIIAILLGIAIGSGIRVAGIAAAVLGALMIVAPLAISMPSKASAADQLNRNLEPVMTEQGAVNAEQALATVEAFGTQVQSEMLPAVLTQLNATPADLARISPELAGALETFPESLARFRTVVATYSANVPNYLAIKPVSFREVTWVTLGGGIVMVLAGLAGAAASAGAIAGEARRRRMREAA